MSLRILVLFASCLLPLAASGAEHPKEYYDPEVQRLIKVREFAFGPTGYAGVTSEGERCFTALVKRRESVRYIIAAFDAGSPEARCYCLVALREYSAALFSEYLETFRNNAPERIRVMEGCLVSEVPSLKLADDINRGLYRKYFVQHEGEK